MTSTINDIKVTILGSGTCVPSLSRSSCSILMETGNSKLLFDSGPGTMRRLLKAGTTIFDISFIFYSHLHPDHTSELVPLIFALKYPDSTLRKTPLTIVAGKGFLDFFSGLENVYGEWIKLKPGLMNIVELDNTREDTLKSNDFIVESIPVDHMDVSLAYRITSKDGTSVVYSGDTDYSENLIDLAKGADVLICESAFPDALKVPGHLTPSQAGRIGSLSKVKKLVLTHFYPECDKVDIAKECRRTYSGELVLARDLMEI